MPRKPRPLDRDFGRVVRDASLIIIASEDTHAVDQYFSRFKPERVQFIVLPTKDGHSSPMDVMKRIDKFKEENATVENDQFWLCIDQDDWANDNHIANLTQVLAHCRNKGYQIALSNPCFEFWLLLHFEDSSFSSGVKCADVAARFKVVVNGYNKAKCCGHLPFTAAMVHKAVERAKGLDKPEPIASTPLSRVYLILEELLKRDSIDLSGT